MVLAGGIRALLGTCSSLINLRVINFRVSLAVEYIINLLLMSQDLANNKDLLVEGNSKRE